MKRRLLTPILALALLFATACTPQQAIAAIFPHETAKATRVASCESELVPTAVSPTNDHGLFQINAPTWNKPWHPDPVAQWIGANWHKRYDPVTNAIMAKMIRDKYGWAQWTCGGA